MPNANVNAPFGVEEVKIGNTLYIVKTMPSESATESINRKVERFITKRITEELKNAGNPINKPNLT